MCPCFNRMIMGVARTRGGTRGGWVGVLLLLLSHHAPLGFRSSVIATESSWQIIQSSFGTAATAATTMQCPTAATPHSTAAFIATRDTRNDS